MANVYVYSGAAGGGTGADWANAYTTLAAAFTGGANGDTFYVAHDHAETQASAMTITAKGTAASPCRVLCVTSAGTVPPVAADLRTTATITTTGANAMAIAGTSAVCYFEGITFSAGTGATNAALSLNTGTEGRMVFKNCAFKKLGTTAVTGAIVCGNASSPRQSTVWENCTVELGAAADGINGNGRLVWRDTASAYAGATIPTTGLFNLSTNPINVYLEGVDLSALTPGTSTIFRAGTGGASTAFMKDCKLGASVVVAATPSNWGISIDMVRCDSGDTNYRSERYQYAGTLTTETTTVRTGGASDGTTTIAWEIVPTANNEFLFPFECFPISIWNETTGSAITLTVEGYWAGGAVPTNADIWMDVEYLATSGFPLGDFSYGGPATVLTTASNHTASTETWGAGGSTKFKMSKTITAAEKGPITVYIKYANATNTCWIDPKITVS